MRIRVADVLEMLAGGATSEQILASYPYLELDDIRASLEYASTQLSHPVISAAAWGLSLMRNCRLCSPIGWQSKAMMQPTLRLFNYGMLWIRK
jgi:hypothetical protein